MESKEHLTRQFDLVPDAILATPIIIVGAGAVGSFTTLCLAKMGFERLTVYDADTVSTVNLGNQFYRFTDVDRPKVHALSEIVWEFAKISIKGVNARIVPASIVDTAPIVIFAVDSMTSRSDLWGLFKTRRGVRFVIDPRMGGEHASLKVVRSMLPSDWAWYEKTLYSDSEVAQEPCTAKATVYTATMLSGLVAQTVRDCLTNTQRQEIVWDIKQHVLEAE